MGTYSGSGIISEILISKDLSKNLNIDLNVAQLKQEVNIDYYNFSEDAYKYLWEIKPDLLEINLVEFLAQQFRVYRSKEAQNLEEVLQALTKVKGKAAIMKLAAKIFDYIQVPVVDCVKIMITS